MTRKPYQQTAVPLKAAHDDTRTKVNKPAASSKLGHPPVMSQCGAQDRLQTLGCDIGPHAFCTRLLQFLGLTYTQYIKLTPN